MPGSKGNKIWSFNKISKLEMWYYETICTTSLHNHPYH